VSGAESVRVELGPRSYEVHVGPGARDRAIEVLAEVARDPGVIVLSDDNVREPHARLLLERLRARDVPVVLHRPLPAGERSKSLTVVEAAARDLASAGVERGHVVLGLGGGATTDVAGFVAAITLRGLRFASFPTTLLGQVDAAVGGKTGVNLPEGKNLVGAFHQPLVVACDPEPLRTLPPREFRAGLAEVVKTAWLGDADLFERLEADPPVDAAHPALPDTVHRCVAVKAAIVSDDEREGGRRASLNFGHTIGHAIETASQGRYLHGEAISLGLVAAVALSVGTGRCPAPLLERMIAVLESMGLPTRDASLDPDRVLELTGRDKKRAGGKDRYQLTAGIGLVSVAEDLPEGAPRAALDVLRR
jgi:3-dehydroquinate synthase